MSAPTAVAASAFGDLDRLIASGRLKEAAVSLKKIMASGSDGLEARLRLGRLQALMGLLERAEKTFTDALALDPDSARPLAKKELYLALGGLHDRMGRREEARVDFYKATECGDEPTKWRRLESLPSGRKPSVSAPRQPRTSALAVADQKTLIIDGTTRCNQTCDFCFEMHLHNTKRDHSLPEIKRVVTQAKKDGYKLVLFMGGEITLVPWLASAIAFIKKSGLRAGIATNGVLLSAPNYVRQLKRAKIDWIELSPLSHIPEDDEKLGHLKGGQEMRLKALQNINDAGIALCINIVVNTVNVGYLREMIASLRKFRIDRLTLKMLHITENVKDASLIPRYDAMRPSVEAAMEYMEKEGMTFRFEGIPLCVVPPRYHSHQENKKNLSGFGYQYDSKIGTKDFPEFLYPDAFASPKCGACAVNKSCNSQSQYVRIFGDAELRPGAVPLDA
jgi:MoaA/NifB/PqqE/SkfB family radical SAM enzyme